MNKTIRYMSHLQLIRKDNISPYFVQWFGLVRVSPQEFPHPLKLLSVMQGVSGY